MINTTKRNNFRLDIPDNNQTKTFQWQVQRVEFPSVSIEQAKVIKSPKLSNRMIAGTATNYDDFVVTFLLDENMESYSELYSWLLTMQNPVGPTTVSEDNTPRTVLLHIMDNIRDKIVTTFKFYNMYPKSLGGIEWSYTDSGDLESMTCTCTFDYEFFDIVLPDGKTVSPRP